MSWNLRYAPHLGYRPPFEPLFKSTVANDDLVEHVAFAAEQGFAGVCFPAARGRSPEEQERVGQALARHGLEAGCVLYIGFDQLRNTSWATRGENARAWIASELNEAISVAKRVGARRLAVLAGADQQRPLALQQATMAEHLRWAGDLVARSGMTICLETLSRKSMPGMLLQHIPDAYAVARAADHPAVRLIFDTSHVQIMDGDLLFHLEQVWEMVEVVQLADNPGRFEPGTGEINFEAVLRKLSHCRYQGLVELEYGWERPGIASERRGLETLRRLDAATAGPARHPRPLLRGA
jgi:hydroxypyruvate isomerase